MGLCHGSSKAVVHGALLGGGFGFKCADCERQFLPEVLASPGGCPPIHPECLDKIWNEKTLALGEDPIADLKLKTVPVPPKIVCYECCKPIVLHWFAVCMWSSDPIAWEVWLECHGQHHFGRIGANNKLLSEIELRSHEYVSEYHARLDREIQEKAERFAVLDRFMKTVSEKDPTK